MSTLWTIWRLHYNMPINDPRVLDATDEDVLEDMLILHFRQQQHETPDTAASLRQTVERMGGMNQVADYLDKLRERLDALPERLPKPKTMGGASGAPGSPSRFDANKRLPTRKGPVKP